MDSQLKTQRFLYSCCSIGMQFFSIRIVDACESCHYINGQVACLKTLSLPDAVQAGYTTPEKTGQVVPTHSGCKCLPGYSWGMNMLMMVHVCDVTPYTFSVGPSAGQTKREKYQRRGSLYNCIVIGTACFSPRKLIHFIHTPIYWPCSTRALVLRRPLLRGSTASADPPRYGRWRGSDAIGVTATGLVERRDFPIWQLPLNPQPPSTTPRPFLWQVDPIDPWIRPARTHRTPRRPCRPLRPVDPSTRQTCRPVPASTLRTCRNASVRPLLLFRFLHLPAPHHHR